MAKSPVFLVRNKSPFIEIKEVDFLYHSGFSVTQKQKCIRELHQSFLRLNPTEKVLEVSTKSESAIGSSLSAFNLMIKTSTREFAVENAFQSSKVFERGGPYKELLDVSPRAAKREIKLKESGNMIKFDYFNQEFPLEPKDFFYNWLYINTLNLYPELCKQVISFTAFTDIEFNPQKSYSCQAKAVALYVSLYNAGLLEKALLSKDHFFQILYGDEKEEYHQLTLSGLL